MPAERARRWRIRTPVFGWGLCQAGLVLAAAQAWVEDVAQPVAEQIGAEHDQHDRQGGEDAGIPCRCDIVAGVGDHFAPGRNQGGYAEAEKAEGRLGEDHRAEGKRGGNDDGRDRVGQDVAEHDAHIRGADGAGGLDKVALADAEHLTAYEAGIADPGADAEEEDDIEKSAADEGDGGDQEDKKGDGGLGIGDPHDDVAGEAAAVACDQAQDDADGQPQDGSGCANQQRDARTDENAAENVAPDVIRAHHSGAVFRVEPGGLGEGVGQVDGDGVMRGQQGAKMAMKAKPIRRKAPTMPCRCVQASPHMLLCGLRARKLRCAGIVVIRVFWAR